MKAREPQQHENPKTTLFVTGQKTSQILKLATADLATLKRPFVERFTKKNDIHPFDDASSLEFFSLKNDTSLLALSLHSKKRPHCLTLVRTFDHKLLDMLELYINPDTFRTLQQFKNKKPSVGLKPLMSFHGTVFEDPNETKYTLAKSLLVDLFRGQDTEEVDVEALFASLREEIRRSGGDPGAGGGPEDRHAARAEAERLWPVSADRPLRLRPGFRGGLGTPVKAVLRKLMRWYVEPLAAEQRAFNDAALKLIDELAAEVDRLRAELAELRARTE